MPLVHNYKLSKEVLNPSLLLHRISTGVPSDYPPRIMEVYIRWVVTDLTEPEYPDGSCFIHMDRLLPTTRIASAFDYLAVFTTALFQVENQDVLDNWTAPSTVQPLLSFRLSIFFCAAFLAAAMGYVHCEPEALATRFFATIKPLPGVLSLGLFCMGCFFLSYGRRGLSTRLHD
jgi:hypothetical protein